MGGGCLHQVALDSEDAFPHPGWKLVQCIKEQMAVLVGKERCDGQRLDAILGRFFGHAATLRAGDISCPLESE